MGTQASTPKSWPRDSPSWLDSLPAFNAGDVAVCPEPAANATHPLHHVVSASTLATKSPRLRSTKSPRRFPAGCAQSGESEKKCAVLAVHYKKPEVHGAQGDGDVDGAQALAARSKIDAEEEEERAQMRSRAARVAVVKANKNLLALNFTNLGTRRKS